MSLDILRKAGLTDVEIKIYETVLDLGIAPINKIHEKSGVERRYIYDILNKLMEKGLISYIAENGKRNFQVTYPKKLLTYINEKIIDFKKIEENIQEEMPVLMERFHKNKPVIGGEIYRGMEGFKAIAEEMLENKDNWIIGGSGEADKTMTFYWKHYNKRRIKNKVMWHDLIKSGTLMTVFKNMNKSKLKKNYYEYKTLPQNIQGPNIIVIYGDKVANMYWKEGLFAFVIHNKDIAKSYLDYFDCLWKISV